MSKNQTRQSGQLPPRDPQGERCYCWSTTLPVVHRLADHDRQKQESTR